tara:strand:+ start:82 stop:300 length:219 start_codon:yes stop_codon:yes gene_type:complete
MFGAINEMLQNNLVILVIISVAAFILAGWNFYNLNKTGKKEDEIDVKKQPVEQVLTPPSELPEDAKDNKKDS